MNLLENQQAAETIDSVYIDLEVMLMQNIARHLRDWEQPIDSDKWLILKLAEIGKLNKENLRIIAQMSGLSRTAAERMLNELAEEAIQDMEPGFRYLVREGLANEAVDAAKSKNVKQVMKRMREQANDTLNLTNTTMLHKASEAFKSVVFSVSEEAIKILNSHAGAVTTGAEARQQALRTVIRQFNDKGITGFVDKRGRSWTPEAYVNMAIRNTAKNVADEVQSARCLDHDINLIEISSHAGARPKCAKDQGKIFDLKNGSGTIDDLKGRKIEYYPWNSSSYGEPDGILGINCHHHKFPFIPGVSIQRHFPTEDFEENDRLYKQTQVQRALEREVRKQKRECMLYDTLEDKEAFEEAAVRLKAKEAKLREYVDSHKELHRRKDREQVVGFDKRISAEAIANKKRVAEKANKMYDIGSEEENVKAYYRDKSLREKIQSSSTKKELESGQFKKHVRGSHEYEQYQEKYKRQGQFGPSYLTIDDKEAQELVDRYAGTGILTRRKDGAWANEEVITVHTQDIGVAVNNLNGQEAPTSVFKIKYGKNGTHVVPDYPSKKGAKARK